METLFQGIELASEGAIALAAAVLTLVAFVFLAWTLAGLRRGRLVRAGATLTFGVLLIALLAVFASLLLNLHTYHRLTEERPVATLTFEALGPQHFRAYLDRLDANGIQRYEIHGDEWHLDARILKWKGGAVLLGMDALYRLERIGGRYSDLEQERTARRSVFALAAHAGLDLWALSRRYQRWLPWVDATYGTATYLPMADKARFEVRIAHSGLIGRPANLEALEAVKRWNP